MRFLIGLLTLGSAVASAGPTVTEILNVYPSVSNALVRDQLVGAQDAAELLGKLATQWLAENTESTSKADVESMSVAAKSIGEAEDLDDARIAFIKMSQGAIAIVRADTALQEEWQLFFCPMVAKKQGYWMQPKGEEIANPYMGSVMPSCGGKKPW